MAKKRPLRVLIADDNEINRAVIKGMLEYARHQVDTAHNGKQVITALAKARYDLVLMDCLMPVMDGFETTRCIRAATGSEFDPNIPILAITALTAPEDRSRCLDAGMSGYISKPVSTAELFAWIDLNLDPGPPLAGYGGTRRTDRKQSFSAAELIRQLSPALLRDAAQWQQELRTLCDSNQLDELGALAHKIRGTGDVLGFDHLSEIAAGLEKSGKSGNAVDAPIQALQLIEELQSLIRKI